MSNEFRTTFSINKPTFSISYQSRIVSIGSCFAENISNRLLQNKFKVESNPFGITYNPFSIADGLQKLLNKKIYKESDLFFQNELWNSFDHHSDFSHADKKAVLEDINNEIKIISKALIAADVLIITLGSAYYYSLKKNGQVVNNCHKLPDKEFEQQLAGVEEIVKTLSAVFKKLFTKNKKVKIILSVSPVRYMKFGAAENQLSKSNLIVACHELKKQFSNVYYFPAYELMLDDLRDYRFYAEDMIHPNPQAVEYIWNKFKEIVISKSCYETINEIEKLKRGLAHRPRNENSAGYKKFLKNILAEIKSIEQKNQDIDFTIERMRIELAIER